MATAEALLTAREFGRMPDDGRRVELVRGRIIESPPPGFLPGLVCIQTASTQVTRTAGEPRPRMGRGSRRFQFSAGSGPIADRTSTTR